MRLPDWLYRAMPFHVAITGLLVLYTAGNWMGYVSGSMLLAIAFIDWKFQVSLKETGKSS